MVKVGRKRLFRITNNVKRAYQLFLAYYPHVYYKSYKPPAQALNMKPDRLSRICRGVCVSVTKEELDLLLEKLFDKKIEELKNGCYKNERIPLNKESQKIIKKFTEIKGSCKKAALELGCNVHTYEKYCYEEAKTINRNIFDRIASAMIPYFSMEELRKSYPSSQFLFSPLPWKNDELKEKYLKKIGNAKTSEEKERIIKNFAWRFLLREVNVNKKSDLYVPVNQKERYKYISVNEDIKKLFEMAEKAMGGMDKVIDRLNIRKNQISRWLNNNKMVPEPVVMELINMIYSHYGVSELHSVFGFSDLERLLERAQKKNKVPYLSKYRTKDVKELIINYVEETKRRGLGLISILNKVNERISKSSFYDFLHLKKTEIPKSLVEAIIVQLKEWGAYEMNEEKLKNLMYERRIYISSEIKEILEEIARNGLSKEVASLLNVSDTLFYNIRKGITKTISQENYEKLKEFVNKNIYKTQNQDSSIQ